jgi:hypothetical protein
VQIGEAIGHADCPGMKDIKAIKAIGWEKDSKDGMDVRWRRKCPPDGIEKPAQPHDVACFARVVSIQYRAVLLWRFN